MLMVTLYGIPNCNSVKKARLWLDDNKIEYTFHNFKKEGLTELKLKEWLSKSSLDKVVNKRGTTYRKFTDSQKNNLDENVILENLSVIKRPVIELNNTIQIGYDENEFLEFFNKN